MSLKQDFSEWSEIPLDVIQKNMDNFHELNKQDFADNTNLYDHTIIDKSLVNEGFDQVNTNYNKASYKKHTENYDEI